MRVTEWYLSFILFAAGISIGGCGIEPIEPGIYTPPTQKQILVSPADLDLEYESVEIPIAADHVLQGWFVPAVESLGTVQINHGALFNRTVLLPHCLILHDLGYNVLVYDYQGFGDSGGVAGLETLIPDANAALDYLRNRGGPGSERIVLFGVSLGTRVTMAQAVQNPPGVVGVIFDGSFVNDDLPPWTYLLFGVIPFPEAVERMIEMYPELDPYQYIEGITLPKLFLQSPQDAITPMDGARKLYDLAPEPKIFHEVFGGHLMPSVLASEYPRYLEEFLVPLPAGKISGE